MAGKRPRDELVIGSAEHVQLFLAAVEEVHVCRGVRNTTAKKFGNRGPSWRKANSAELVCAHSKVDDAFVEAAELRVGINLESLAPCVHDKQWQPHSQPDLRRKLSANLRSSASASGHSTPSRTHQSTAGAIKQLDSRSKASGGRVRTPEQIEQNKAECKLAHQ